MNRHIKHLTADDLAHFGDYRAAAVLRLGAVDDDRQGVDFLAIQQNVDLDHVGRTKLFELIVHRRIATADRLELVEEVEHDFA